MKVSTYTWQRIVLSIGTLALVSACGGGGGGSGSSSATDSSALKVDSKISIMEPKASKSASKVSLLSRSSGESRSATVSRDFALPATSAYVKDETFYYVQDESSESLNVVNSLLCKFEKMKATDMAVALKGDYIALIDEAMCDQEKGGTSSESEGGKSNESAESRPELNSWTVNSEMTDNDTMVVKMWVLAEEMDTGPEMGTGPQLPGNDEGPKTMDVIRAKMTVERAVSGLENPFSMNFAFYKKDKAGNIAVAPHIKGFLNKTALVGGENKVDFYNEMTREGSTYPEGVTVTYNPTTKVGSGTTLTERYDYETNALGTTINDFAYNISNFLRQSTVTKNGNEVIEKACMNRNDFHETAWRYGLYDSADGKRVEVNSGFPITATKNGETYQGWAGLWGLWMPQEAGVKDGSEVTKESYKDGEVGEAFTVVQTKGKLRKHTKKTLSMNEIKNIPLIYWNNALETEFQVIWNGTNLVKIAQRNKSNWQWSKLDDVPVEFTKDLRDFSFYAQALGGAGQINLGGEYNPELAPVVSAENSKVIFHKEEDIFADDNTVPVNLACYDTCIDPSKIDAVIRSERFFPNNYDTDTAPEAYTYENNVLNYGGVPVTSETYTNNLDGIWSGALIEDTVANRNKLLCVSGPKTICAWQLFDKIDVFYTWVTGPNEWNKTTSLKSVATGVVTKFDLPKLVAYTHKGEDQYKGSKFYLDYAGFGNLWGIPEVCMYSKTGVIKDCWNVPREDFESNSIRWMSQFVIPESVNGIRSTASETIGGITSTYVIKPLDVEQSQKSVDEAACNGLTLASSSAGSFPLNMESWVDPAIGAMPAVKGAPSVISGVVQE